MQKRFMRLRGRIIERFGTYVAFASAAGIEKNCLSAKLSGKTKISMPEAARWSQLLGIEDVDFVAFFYDRSSTLEHSEV